MCDAFALNRWGRALAPRSTTRRDRHRKIIAQDQPPCHLCGQNIDYQAHHHHPNSFTIHHLIPINRGGPDALFLDDGTPQIVAAHRKCNRDQGDRLPGERPGRPGVTFVTHRKW